MTKSEQRDGSGEEFIAHSCGNDWSGKCRDEGREIGKDRHTLLRDIGNRTWIDFSGLYGGDADSGGETGADVGRRVADHPALGRVKSVGGERFNDEPGRGL